MPTKNGTTRDDGVGGLILFVAAEQSLTVLVAVDERAAVLCIGDPYRESATEVSDPAPWCGTPGRRGYGKL